MWEFRRGQRRSHAWSLLSTDVLERFSCQLPCGLALKVGRKEPGNCFEMGKRVTSYIPTSSVPHLQGLSWMLGSAPSGSLSCVCRCLESQGLGGCSWCLTPLGKHWEELHPQPQWRLLTCTLCTQALQRMRGCGTGERRIEDGAVVQEVK